MQDNEKKPALRFKGFTDPWEQRKLGEIAVFSKGVGYSKNDLCEEGTPIILYGRLYTKYETCIFDVDTFVKEKAGGVYSKGGEVIVPASGETAEDISIASVVVKPGILLGGDLNIVSPTAEYDSAFLALTISSGATHKYLSSLAQGKSVVHLHNADIQSVSAKFPTKREQEKIHLLFGKIDTLITLHQRKYEKLVNIKKSMLDKMFPQNGASVPEIRFKSFTDPWEQRKLGEMVDVCSGMDYKHLSEGDIPVYGTGGYMLSVNKALSYDRNAVGIGRKGTIDKPYILKAPFWTVDTLFYAIPKDSKNIDFTFDVFQKVDWKKKDESTGVPSLSKIAINETSISTPSKLEQERIGSFFRNLDTLITLHQREHIKPILEVKRVKRNE